MSAARSAVDGKNVKNMIKLIYKSCFIISVEVFSFGEWSISGDGWKTTFN